MVASGSQSQEEEELRHTDAEVAEDAATCASKRQHMLTWPLVAASSHIHRYNVWWDIVFFHASPVAADVKGHVT